MTKAEAIEHLKDILDDVPNDKCIDWIEALNKAIEVLGQEPCEDCISRQAMLDATVKKNSIWNSITNSKGENLEEIISQLPPATPQPKIGHWIVGNYHIRCSECGEDYTYRLRNYCPNCGAKMQEVEE